MITTNHLSQWPLSNPVSAYNITDYLTKGNIQKLLCVSKEIRGHLSQTAFFQLKNKVIVLLNNSHHPIAIFTYLLNDKLMICLSVNKTWELVNMLQLNIKDMWQVILNRSPRGRLPNDPERCKLLDTDFEFPIIYDVLWRMQPRCMFEASWNGYSRHPSLNEEKWDAWGDSSLKRIEKGRARSIVRRASYLTQVKTLYFKNCTITDGAFETLKLSGKGINAIEAKKDFRTCTQTLIGFLMLATVGLLIGGMYSLSTKNGYGGILFGSCAFSWILPLFLLCWENHNRKPPHPERVYLPTEPTEPVERQIGYDYPSGYLSFSNSDNLV